MDVTAGAAVRMSVAAAKKKGGSRLNISSLGTVLKEPGSEVVRIWLDGKMECTPSRESECATERAARGLRTGRHCSER